MYSIKHLTWKKKTFSSVQTLILQLIFCNHGPTRTTERQFPYSSIKNTCSSQYLSCLPHKVVTEIKQDDESENILRLQLNAITFSHLLPIFNKHVPSTLLGSRCSDKLGSMPSGRIQPNRRNWQTFTPMRTTLGAEETEKDHLCGRRFEAKAREHFLGVGQILKNQEEVLVKVGREGC